MNQNFNKTLLNLSQTTMRISFLAAQIATRNLPFKVVNFNAVKDAFLNVGIDVPTTQLDFYYRFVDEKTMHEIWEFMIPIVSKLKYLRDFQDCDNFGHLMSSLIPWLFGINSCGTAYGKVEPGLHYFNVFPTSDGKVFCGEPINGNIVQIERGFPIKMLHGWTYSIRGVRFF